MTGDSPPAVFKIGIGDPIAAKNPFSHLMDLKDFQQARHNLFPSLDSLRWYVRTNLQLLASSDAVQRVNGRLFVDPGRFDACVLKRSRDDQLAMLEQQEKRDRHSDVGE